MVSNAGAGTATIVTLNDPLPAALTWALGTVTGDIGGVACAVNGAPGAQILQCADNDGMTTGQSFTVTVTTTTSSAQCATYPNVATVDATNESNDPSAIDDNTDPGAITVNCPDVTVLKEADASPVNAGDPIGFTITVSNAGAGVAYDVALTDTLPAGIAWLEDSDACSIAAGVLSCDFGDLAPGASVQAHLTGTTDAADCGTLTNTAVVSASNEAESATANNTSTDSVVVNCPDVQALKVADASPVNAGDQIGFTVTIMNPGPARLMARPAPTPCRPGSTGPSTVRPTAGRSPPAC